MIKQHYIAGSITAGCFSTFIGHPLDTIKVYQQTHHVSKKRGIIHIAKLLADGDLLRLFRGIGAPMANQILMNSVMFTVFHNMKDVANQSTILNENSSALVAGLFSGFATACLSTPTDWLKIQAQVSLSNNNGTKQQPTRRYDMASILKHRLLQDRKNKFDISYFIRTIYRGHVANLGREGVFTMVYLGMYDRICSAVKERRRASLSNNNDNFEDDDPLGTKDIVLISSFTGAFAWISNYPFDTIKTIIQANTTQKKITVRDAIRSIYNSGGYQAFWRGVGSSTFRAMLVTSTRMLAYEKTIQLLNAY